MIDRFKVSFLPGFADRGTFSVCDSYSPDFGSMFDPAGPVGPFVHECQNVLSMPSITPRMVVASSLREHAGLPEPMGLALFKPLSGATKPYEFGAGQPSSSAKHDESSLIHDLAVSVVGI